MDKSLLGKTALVTGAGRGMGRAHAHHLAKLGANVVITDVNLESAKEFGEKLDAPTVLDELLTFGVKSAAFEGDIADRSFVDRMVADIERGFGGIDILVNNAGGAFTPVETSMASTTTDQELDALFSVNFRGAVNCCQSVIPVMKRKKPGAIVNISTVNANEWNNWGSGMLSGYAASKAALGAYSRHLAAEVGPFGIRVNLIAPGFIATTRVITQAAERGVATKEATNKIPLRRLGNPDDVSGVVEFLVTDLSRYVTGQTITVCGGMSIVGD